MSQERELIEAIADTPYDDLARLIYADWLEDHGRPERAEFIRVQCRLEEMSEDDPERPTLADRERALLATHRDEWLRGLPLKSKRWPFRRGFLVPEFDRTARAFVRLRIAPYSPFPLWTGFLSGEGDSFAQLAGCSHLSRLTWLSLRPAWPRQGGITGPFPSVVKLFASKPPFVNLRTLTLLFVSPSDEGLAALAASEGLSQLTSLSWLSGDLSDAGVAALAGSPVCARLRSLSFFSQGGITDEGVVALAGSPRVVGLRELNLHGSQIGDAAVQALIDSPYLGCLSRLLLQGVRLTDPHRDQLRSRFGERVAF